jgi:hypothetical protein
VTGQHLVRVFRYFVLKFLGPVLALKASNFTLSNTGFCTEKLGVACSPDVTALLQFLAQVEYPVALLSTWMGNNRCTTWLDVTCSVRGHVMGLNLPGHAFSGTISPSFADLTILSTSQRQLPYWLSAR